MTASPAAAPMIGNYEIHPAANLLPLLEPDALAELADDIRRHGLHEPIVRLDGRILDGRNRLLACESAGVEPRFREWSSRAGELPSEWVLSVNAHRRHLSKSQLAMIAVDILPEIEREASERKKATQFGPKAGKPEQNPVMEQNSMTAGAAREKVAKAAGVSGKYVSDAKKLQTESPEIAKRVTQGKLSIPAAKKEAKKSGGEKENAAEAKPEVPDGAKEEWDLFSTQLEKILKPLRLLDAAIPEAVSKIYEFEYRKKVETGLEPRVWPTLERVLGLKRKNLGTAASPNEKFQSDTLRAIGVHARLSQPSSLCENCKGTTKCPGERCLKSLDATTRARTKKPCLCGGEGRRCAGCDGRGFLDGYADKKRKADERR